MEHSDTSRFEVLEEETHYPVTHPQSADKKIADANAEASCEKTAEDETLEQQLTRLVQSIELDDRLEATSDRAEKGTSNVKRASAAKELGNKYVLR